MMNLYVTSPLRKSGKTFISAGIAATMQSLGYSTGVYKPIQTSGTEKNGFMQSPDLTYVKKADPYINTHFSYLYKIAAEPAIASEAENEIIDIELIIKEFKKIITVTDCALIDGDGGIFSPIAPNLTARDMIKELATPVLIVVKPDDNAINTTLLTINALHETGIPICGVVINNIKTDCPKILLSSIPRVIEEYTDVKVLGLVQHINGKYTPEDLITSVLNGIDIESIFGVRIAKLG